MLQVEIVHFDPTYEWYSISPADIMFDALVVEREGLYWAFSKAAVENERHSAILQHRVASFKLEDATPVDSTLARLLFPG